MAKVEHAEGHRRIVETPTEARQAEPGPSVLALLAVSTVAAIFVLGDHLVCLLQDVRRNTPPFEGSRKSACTSG